ncbi:MULTISPECIES: cytochrome d ubiquinol oxidase subunit II [Auritidibacter]|uniref:cytochrome d ubiquinol oxidase subunit II n=1 Tax=Auritidibacter TaxID=1160973 RepID=UPI000D72A5BD|nr:MULTISPECIES: cytochrome d ubiquinol oxidase subunit II [Auritidibacter]AXR73672.1 cytochrome d ubiquinol oxidase subunit II [Auritidibacter sp. NML130574]NIH70413.1 cytochrome d ubiquinol oxidase subunit II [Auritidibacter ignavus]PXA81404.1 cytochrome d ubiquinol oxidase subunit II [Auritidibacter sp. NML120636]RMX23645.1 cytochrome d ubiquinol oxidase subunit II [Auritidibacter ignavus]WGH82312.1 cytochrome d ubiquinol oxidase subunit II [Auritidibacter ignavus]
MEFLPTLWFILIAVLWTGYLVLEGFDLGVGMLMKFWARNESQRRVLLNTIGPVWDGNEVWLITAGGATFAAFPMWYASLFSTLYIPLTLALLGLIFRAVAIEYRGKAHTTRVRNLWDWALCLGSLTAAFCVGAMLAITTTGLPLNENGDRVGHAFVWLNSWAVIGGLAVVGFALAQGWAFLGLKTMGAPRAAAKRHLSRWLWVYLLPMAGWAVGVLILYPKVMPWILLVVAVAGMIAALVFAAQEREGWAFFGMTVFVAAGVAAIFWALYPNVLPSTLNDAWNLTVNNASSSDYTLTVMAVVAAIFVPIVLAYSSWSYWVFRKRIAETHIPESKVVTPV